MTNLTNQQQLEILFHFTCKIKFTQDSEGQDSNSSESTFEALRIRIPGTEFLRFYESGSEVEPSSPKKQDLRF